MASSSSPTCLWKYDVFLSFRGPDTRKNIVSHIYSALRNKGIFTFRDDRTMEIGNSIPDELARAIQTSRFAIVVISENYATSTWCLEELRMIMELQAVEGGISVVPIFYRVSPCDVRHQKGSFATAFANMVGPETAEMVLRWRTALTRVAGLSGFDSSKRVDEATMVEDVVRHLLDRLFPAHTTDEDVVGMGRHMEGLGSLLEMESEEEVRFVGILGMGGVGKTTIAKYLYRRFSRQFPARCFIADVNKDYKEQGLPYLRKRFLSEIVGDEHIRLGNVGAGSDEIKRRLRHQKVFAVLDDVDQVEQLHGLAKDQTWFGSGSRIIIITRDKGLLDTCGVQNVYPVKCLDQEEALQMFKHIAFGGEPCPDGFDQLLIRASRLAHGLPFALQAYSLHLHRKTAEEWDNAVREFEKGPHKNIFHILRRSYESLDTRDKIAFLHVACLFNGHHFLRASSLLDNGECRIKSLEDKSLVDISAQGFINMHVLVEETGRELVLEESDHIPQRQRILWGNNVYDVLVDNIGTERIEGLALDMCEMPDVLQMAGNSFKPMPNVKFLKFYTHLDNKRSKLELLSDAASLPRMLRLLRWDDYPLTSLPAFPRGLVELTLRRSSLQFICNNNMYLKNLKRLDVSGSTDLRELPDLSTATQLEELVAEGCRKLKLINLMSIRGRYSLRNLDLSNCVGLRSLPLIIPEWISLAKEAIFFRCKGTRLKFEIKALGPFANLSIEGDIQIRLQQLVGDAEHLSYNSEQLTTGALRLRRPSNWPESHISGESLVIKRSYYNNGGAPFRSVSFSDFSCLAELKLINLNIGKLPDDMDLLHSLEKLDLSGNDFKHLPTTLDCLEKLKYLVLCNCRKLEELPNLSSNLQSLKLSGCTNLQSLPANWCRSQLLELDLDKCKNVQSLTHGLGQFTNLTLLDLSGHEFQTIPTSITKLLLLETLCLNNCTKLKSLKELPLSLNYLNAHGCISLETVSLPLNHSIEHVDLSHCCQLNQCEEVITQFLTAGKNEEALLRFACIPGTVIPSYFDNQSAGESLQVSPNRMGFAACIMVACRRPYHLQFVKSSYSWKREAGGVFRINLSPNIYRSCEMEEEEPVGVLHYLVIIHVSSRTNKDQVANLVFNSALQIPQMSEFPPVEIKACGARIDGPNQI